VIGVYNAVWFNLFLHFIHQYFCILSISIFAFVSVMILVCTLPPLLRVPNTGTLPFNNQQKRIRIPLQDKLTYANNGNYAY
jgi:hypothetical protein